MKAVIRWMLDRTVNRARFNDSVVYGLYLRVAAPVHSAAKAAERSFYRALIEPLGGGLIFDIGANAGEKTRIFGSLAHAVVAVEPDPAAVALLEERFRYVPSVRIAAIACGASEGCARLHVFDGSDNGYNTLSVKWLGELSRGNSAQRERVPIGHHDVAVTTLDSLIEQHGVPTYIKIDVEGFEWDVIQGLSQVVPMISIECNLPAFERETLHVVDRRCTIDPSTRFNYVTTEPPRDLVAADWLTREEIERVIRSGKITYMELYCRSAARGAP